MVGIGYLGQGQVEKAIDVFKKITAGAPQLPYGHYYLGVDYQRQQQRQAALEAFEQALLLNPNFVQALNRIVAIYVRDGKLDAALERTQAHFKMLPQHPILNDLVGKIHLARKDPKQAEKAFQQAIAADAESLTSHLHLSQLYVSQQAYDQATTQLQAAIAIDPYQVSPRMMLGMVHDQQGDHEQARAAYEKVLEINPNIAAAANNLAWTYAEHGGNLDVALTLAQKAKEANPDDPRIADTLGWIYYKKQLYTKAISEFKESAEQLPNDPVVHYHLGMAYFQNGDQTQAEVALQRALELQGNFDGADQAKQILTSLHQD
jgi:tetratricopeptide (TPR) repeat protein